MAVRPDPEVGFRRPGDHLAADRVVERRVFVQASPREVWATLHDPSSLRALLPELHLGPAEPAWPAAAATRSARAQLGLLRERAWVESLEARPESVFRLRAHGSGFDSEWAWRLEPVAGGTRVIHAASFQANDRWAGLLIRLGRRSLEMRVEAHLRALKERAERSAFPTA
jgi:carbon monoxide dehydrogenase subunit G